jgi:hypothetical protein
MHYLRPNQRDFHIRLALLKSELKVGTACMISDYTVAVVGCLLVDLAWECVLPEQELFVKRRNLQMDKN